MNSCLPTASSLPTASVRQRSAYRFHSSAVCLPLSHAFQVSAVCLPLYIRRYVDMSCATVLSAAFLAQLAIRKFLPRVDWAASAGRGIGSPRGTRARERLRERQGKGKGKAKGNASKEAAREAMQRFLEWLDSLEEQERSGETLAQVQAAEERKWLALARVESSDELLEKARRLQVEHKTQQFVVRPSRTTRSTDLTEGEVDRLRTEQALAGMAGLPWAIRSQSANHKRAWRGQPVRAGKEGGVGRTAKRGGRFK